MSDSTQRRRGLHDLSRTVQIMLAVIVVLVVALVVSAVEWASYESHYLSARRADVQDRLSALHAEVNANRAALARERHDVASLACLLVRDIPPGTLRGVDRARIKYHCPAYASISHPPRGQRGDAERPPARSGRPSVSSHTSSAASAPATRSEPPPSTPNAPRSSTGAPEPSRSSTSSPPPSRAPPPAPSPTCLLPIVGIVCGLPGLP